MTTPGSRPGAAPGRVGIRSSDDARPAARRRRTVRRRRVSGLPGADPDLRGDHGLEAGADLARPRRAERDPRPPRPPDGRRRVARAGDGAAMSELLALGASHKTAPLALRE